MKLSILTRQVHYWITAFIALPVLVIVGTGILLQIKKHNAWVQPPEQAGTGTVPQVTLDEILASVARSTDLGVASWDDVNRMDVRPGKGMVKVWLRNGWEVQVDLGTGQVLQASRLSHRQTAAELMLAQIPGRGGNA